MPAIDTIACFQTTVNSTLAAGVFATGDSGTVRNAPVANRPTLFQVFSDHVTTALPFRFRSPLLHDNVQGMKFVPELTPSGPLMPYEFGQPLEAQDTLICELSTAAATGKACAVAMIYYPQLPGAMARLYNSATINPLIRNFKPVLVTIPITSNTAGIWFDILLSTTENLLHANTDYAVLGILADTGNACYAIKGADTGNLRIGVPGILNPRIASNWFQENSDGMGLPLIPVINSANVNGTYLSFVSSIQNAAAIQATVYLAELSSNLA